MPGRKARWGAVGTTVLVLAWVPSCGSAAGDDGGAGVDSVAATAPPEPQLLLTFDAQEPGPAEGQEIESEGTAAVLADVLSLNKPATVFQPSHLNGGLALRFPKYSGVNTGSFGALRIEPEEWLTPGEAEFTFGAEIRLDATSGGSTIDNGDNVMQRGLFSDSAQYKIQVDKHHPSCVVRGADGSVVVKSKVTLSGAKWYNLSCHRLDKTVTLTVTELGSDQPPSIVQKTGAIGRVDMIGSEPLSIGAKIGADGEIVRSSTDQFNGWIDNISYLRI